MLENNRVLEKIRSGKKVLGAFSNLGSTAVLEALGYSGLDLVIIDTEHGPFDVETTVNLILACEAHGLTPIVRAKDHQRNSVLKMLDIGAMGLLVPFIKTPDQVRELVSYAKYRPVGDRGFGTTRKNGFTMEPIFSGGLSAYCEWANANTLLLPQCETVECLENIEEIAAIEGVDGIFVGPFDLSISMGIPGQFEDPRMVNAMTRVVNACKANGKICLTLGEPGDAAKKFGWGFDGIISSDVSYLLTGAITYVKTIQALGY